MTDSMTTTRSLWQLAGMPDDALNHLLLSGGHPMLPTSFHVGVAAQSTIACAALAAAELAYRRSGARPEVSVDMHDAEAECTGYFDLDGKVPSPWAPLSGLYPCKDGYVRIHANFDHHRDGALRILGLTDDPATVSRDDVEHALKCWGAVDFESAAAEAGMVAAAVRSFSEWDAAPQASEIARLPLFTIERIGDGAPVSLPHIGAGDKPLTNIRVLDLTRILAGPVCGRTLAAYGADVMLVNSPNLPNIEAIADTSRGKLSSLIDLNTIGGTEHLHELIRGAHILVEGYRPGGLASRGFSPEALAKQYPGIIYVTLSAYSHVGPWSSRRGFDSLVQTATGFNHAEAEAANANKPRPLPVQILDYASGFLMTFASQVALMRQMQEGGSWHVRISLAQTAHWLRGLGRIDNNFHNQRPDLTERAQDYSSNYGALRAIPHAARFNNSECDWKRPSVPPGTHGPAWP